VLVPVLIVVMKPVSAAPEAGRRGMLDAGPLLRDKRTSIIRSLMSAFDPKRTFAGIGAS
jgi:hypothetical protein